FDFSSTPCRDRPCCWRMERRRAPSDLAYSEGMRTLQFPGVSPAIATERDGTGIRLTGQGGVTDRTARTRSGDGRYKGGVAHVTPVPRRGSPQVAGCAVLA